MSYGWFAESGMSVSRRVVVGDLVEVDLVLVVDGGSSRLF
jgi:methionine aminopeptidase